MRPALVGESGALDSETIWRPALDLHTDRGYVTRVRAAPRTGRQHQIRVHLRSIGAPLVVDSRYGGAARRVAGELAADSPAVERLTLHAARLSVDHPTRRGRTVVIESPLPDDLSPLDRWLRAGASRPEDQS
jgi:23S rRNA-/tRNA-specific pseudouridylate synthase